MRDQIVGLRRIPAGQGTVTGSVAVAGGVVYAGDTRPELSALGALTGAFRWESGNLGGPVQSPAVAAGLVYATGA